MLALLTAATALLAPPPQDDLLWSVEHAHGAGWESSLALVPVAPDRAWSLIEGNGLLVRAEVDLEGALTGAELLTTLDGALPTAACPDGDGGAFVAFTVPDISTFAGPSMGLSDQALARFRADGTSWITRLGTSLADEVRDVQPDGAGGAFVLGVTDLAPTFWSPGRRVASLRRVDAQGVELWLRLFPFTAAMNEHFDATAMAVDAGTGRVLCVGRSSTGGGDPRAASCTVTFDGVAGTIRLVGGAGSTLSAVALHPNGTFLAAGSDSNTGAALFTRLDAGGAPLGASRTVLTPTAPWGSTSLEHIVSDTLGGAFVLGRTSDHPDPLTRPTAVLARLAPDGEVLWRHDVDPSTEHASFPRDLQPWSGPAACASIQTRAASDGSSASITLLRLDASGVHAAGCAGPLHSAGARATLRATGSDRAGDNAVLLDARDLPSSTFGLFLCSRTAGSPAPSGLCLTGAIGRFVAPGQVWNAGPAGRASLRIDLDALPAGATTVAALPGETWHFQGWFRDGAGSSFTSGAALTLR